METLSPPSSLDPTEADGLLRARRHRPRPGPIGLAMVSYLGGYLCYVVFLMFLGILFGIYVGIKANL